MGNSHLTTSPTFLYGSVMTKVRKKEGLVLIARDVRQNQTPGAYRVFFHYGPDRPEKKRRIPGVTILTITPHP